MHKRSTKLSLLLLASLAVVLLLLFAAPWLIGQERLRRLAEELAREHAGLELHIAEPVTLRLVPRPSLVLEGLSMHLTHGATSAGAAVPLLQAERLGLALAVLPLLVAEVEIAEVELLGPVLHLLRNQEGRWNWQTAPGSSESLNSGPPAASSLTQGFGPLRSLNLRIKQGRVHVQDLANNTTLDLQAMQLELQGSQQDKRFVVEHCTLSGILSGSGLPWDEPVPLDAAATASFAPQAGQLALDIRNASLHQISLEGSLEAQRVFQTPEVQGDLSVSAPVDAVAGLASLNTASQSAGTAILNATFNGDLQELELPSLSLALRERKTSDDLVLHGSGRLRQADTTALELALQGERLDLTPLVTTPSDKSPQQERWPAPGKLLAWTEDLDLDLSLRLDALQIGAFALQEFRLHTVAKHGELRLSGPGETPLASVADGRLLADLRASQQQAGLGLTAHLSLQGGDVLHLLAPLLSAPLLHGATSAQLSLKAQGSDWPGLAASLRGSLQLDIRDGTHSSVEGQNAQRQFSLLKGDFTLQGVADVPTPYASSPSEANPEDSQGSR